MPRRHPILLCWLLVLLALPVRAAEQVQDIHASIIPVPDRSDAALQQAAREALAEVLVKASGSAATLELPVIEAALGNAREHMLQYSYTAVGADGLGARVQFDPTQIRALLAEAGAPLWTANRPTVLLWLVEETPQGRRLASADTDPALVSALLEGFQRRGVSARLPLLDLTDRLALDADAAWQLPTARLRAAAARYGATDILAGRYAAVVDGHYLGDFVYLSTAGREHLAVGRAPPADFAAAGVSLAVDTMAARYAVLASSTSAEALFLEVDGVSSYADYAALLAWLQGLELVSRVDVSSVAGEHLTLRLVSGASPERLGEILQLNDRLTPVVAGAPDRLHYRWRP